MNETKVLDELKMWSGVNAEEFTAVNLSALARGCDMSRVDVVHAVQNLLLTDELVQVRAGVSGSHVNAFKLGDTSAFKED